MISAIVFSKNRALQLDLLLRSIEQNFKQCDQIRIIWKADEEHKESYNNLFKEYRSKVISIEQIEFYKDTWESCRNSKNKYIVFFTDDDIFYRSSPSLDLSYLDDDSYACHSLRLGLNITKRQMGDVWYNDPQPAFAEADNSLFWNRMNILPQSYWNYPLSVDGHIFNKQKIYNILYEIYQGNNIRKVTQTPNKLEGLLQRYFFEVGAIKACPKYSCVVNSPNNRVQSEYQNRSGDQYSYCEDHLNQLYLNGFRINLNNLDFSQVFCPHTEIKLI